MSKSPLPLAVLLSAGFLAAPSTAQVCGPLTFAFATTGAGCGPSAGAVPTLSATLLSSPTLSSCPVEFILAPGPASPPFPVFFPVFLILGTSNPALDLTPFGFAGCTLLASPDAIAPMMPLPTAVPAFALIVQVPASPVLIGVTGYAQGFAVGGSAGLVALELSNGVSVGIS